MPDIQPLSSSDLVLGVQNFMRKESEKRAPLAGAYLTVICVLALSGFTLLVEWKNISLALEQLFPTLSNGQGYGDVTGTLAFASVAAILLAEVLIDKASASWSARTRRLVDLLGIAAIVLFIVSAMVLLPYTVQPSDGSDTAADGSALHNANLAFSFMLAALFPVSVLANFALFERLKPALTKIQGAKEIDRRIRSARLVLARHDQARASLRAVAAQLSTLPDTAQLANEYAASADAVIGKVRGHVGEIIVARETAASAGDTPLVATDDQLFNHQPMEKLRAHYDYLRTFSPGSIRNIITPKEA